MLQMDPRQGIYKLRAIAWMELGDYRQAVADLQTAMLDPQEERSSRLLLEQCYRKLGEVSAADEILEAIAVETDEQTAALLAAIDRLIHRGEFEAAFSRLEQARLSRDSLSLGLTLKLAELLSDHLGDHRRAVELMDELISIDPDPLLLAYQGIYLARDGRRDEAHRLANSLSAGQAASAGIVYRIGRIFALTSRTHPEDADRAFESLQRALALGFGGNRLADEPDLEPIRTLPKFQQLLDRGR
jgi:tetratricopeptide (TPR) repeat protein